MSDRLTIGVIGVPGLRPSADLDALREQEHVTVRSLTDPKQVDACQLLIVPDTAAWNIALSWLKSSGWATVVSRLRAGLVLGIGTGSALLGRTIADGDLAAEGLNALDVSAVITEPTCGIRRATVMGIAVLATGQVATLTCGSDAAPWVHLEDDLGTGSEGGLRLSDARVVATGLTGLFANPVLRDVFCTEIGRRSGLTYVG